MDLTPEQQERLQRLLEEEIRAALLAARRSGASPAAVADLLAGRRQALDAMLPAEALLPADDAQHPLDDPGEGGRVGDQS